MRELSREIRLAQTSVRNCVVELLKTGIVLKEEEIRGTRRFPYFRASLNSKRFRSYKRFFNHLSLTDSGLVEFLEDRLAPKAIVLFGSYQRGEDTEESDIDIFLECGSEGLNLSRFEKKLCRKIQLHFSEDFGKYSGELKNNIINGTVLSGFLVGY